MTWNKFKNWLEEKVLEQNEEEAYTLRFETRKKYSIKREKELIAALTNLIESIDNLPYRSSSNSYSFLSEQNNDYYSLPNLDDLLDKKTQQPLTWQQLFPKRETAFFGKKEEIEAELSEETYNMLGKIFNDWATKASRAERLAATLSEEEIMGKFFLEAAISLNYDLIKRKGYDSQLKAWLAEYNQLEESEQGNLTKQKEMVDKLLTAFGEEAQNRQEQVWYQNIPWKKYGLIGGVIILVIFSVIWIIKFVKNVVA